MALELANDQRAQDIGLRTVDDIDAELDCVLQMRRILVLARVQSAKAALSSMTKSDGSGAELVHIDEYLKGIWTENQLNSTLLVLKDEKRHVLHPNVSKLDARIDGYTILCTGLSITGGAGFTTTFGLIFSGVRGQMELIRWSSLIFAIGFTHSAFLQTTMQFPYIRKQIPSKFATFLPYFVLWIFLCDLAAIVLLYVAVVALDLRPELNEGRTPVLVPKPYISAKGNITPSYIIIIGVVVVGIPWYVAVWRKISSCWNKGPSGHGQFRYHGI